MCPTSNVLYKIQWKLYYINDKLQSTNRKSRIQVQIIEYKCKIIEWKKKINQLKWILDQILQRLTWHWNCALKLFNRFSWSKVTRYWVKPMILMAWHNSSLRCGHTMRFCKSYRVTKVESRKSKAMIESLMFVRFSIDFLVRIVTSQWLFPYTKNNNNGFINWKSNVKLYRVTTSTIDYNWLTWASRFEIGWKTTSCDRTFRQVLITLQPESVDYKRVCLNQFCRFKPLNSFSGA